MGKIFGIGFAAIAVLFGLWFMNTYNWLSRGQIAVEQQYSQISVVIQRQADLIPNMVKVVERYAGHEKSTLTEVTQARAQLTELNKIDPTKIANDPELQKKVLEAQTQMNSAMVKLQSTAEAYPNLKADTQFQQLNTQLEGSVNRISIERRKAQEFVGAFNRRIVTFPNNIVANMFGFEKFKFFTSDEGLTGAAKVEFK